MKIEHNVGAAGTLIVLLIVVLTFVLLMVKL